VVVCSKDIRSNAVKGVCDAYKTAFSNLKAGNIQYFSLGFKKKTELRQQAELASADISMKNKRIQLSPSKLGENCLFKISPRNEKRYGTVDIKNNCDLIKIGTNYWIYLSVPYEIPELQKKKQHIACGVDPGVRTFLTLYDSENVSEFPTCDHIYKIRKKNRPSQDI